MQQVAILCLAGGARGRAFKDELRAQGVIERMVSALAEAEQRRRGATRALSGELFNALARSVFDHRPNAALVIEMGLLRITAASLRASIEQKDIEAANDVLCCCNNTCGMIVTGTHQAVLDAGLIPVLIEIAGGNKSSAAGRQTAIAALANLSNTAELCLALVQGGAVEVLSAGLRNIDVGTKEPTVAYMQALAAVVKTVGRGQLMGGWGSRFAASSRGTPEGREEPDGSVFVISGAQSSRHFNPTLMRGMVVDRRSTRWMIEYLVASCAGLPYPVTSNIYGTAWKVAQSIACMAHGSAQNRHLLCEEGAWPCLVAALLRDYDQEDRLHDGEERRLTEMHVVLAMHKMLRSAEDVAARHDFAKSTLCSDLVANSQYRIYVLGH